MNRAEESTDWSVTLLNNVLTHCFDSLQGYLTAASHVHDSVLRATLFELAERRKVMVDEMCQQIRLLGSEPVTGGSILGALERGWQNIKASMVEQDDHAILAACEHGEQVLISHFDEALQDSSTSSIGSFLRVQYSLLQEAHDTLKHAAEGIHTMSR